METVASPCVPNRSLPERIAMAVAGVTAAVVLMGACSGGSGGDAAGDASLSPEAKRGSELVRSEGCMACHSTDGRGSVGPTWKGLAGSEVELADGETVTADDEYLTRSIKDPSAQIVDGYSGQMPDRKLSDDDIAAIVAYLRTL